MDRIEEMRKKLIDSAKKKVQRKYSERDVHIAKAVGLLEDVDQIANLLIEQLREWHAVHFPELSDIVKDNDSYLKLVSTLGKRDNFSAKKLNDVLQNEELSEQISKASENSMGSEVSSEDLKEMKLLATNCTGMREQREHLSKYLEDTMKKELPAFTELAGPVIGAKILAKVGSKKRLAFIPASALQLIGAEKALFMHFKKGVKGPKYGYLFQHPLVKAAKNEDKGRLARTIASKLAIAAKMDYFGSKESAEGLRKSIEKRAEQLHGAEKKPEKPQKEIPRREFAQRSFEGEGPRRPFPSNERYPRKEGGFGRREYYGSAGYRTESRGRGFGARDERGQDRLDRPSFEKRSPMVSEGAGRDEHAPAERPQRRDGETRQPFSHERAGSWEKRGNRRGPRGHFGKSEGRSFAGRGGARPHSGFARKFAPREEGSSGFGYARKFGPKREIVSNKGRGRRFGEERDRREGPKPFRKEGGHGGHGGEKGGHFSGKGPGFKRKKFS